MDTLKLHWLGHPLVELKGRSIKLETRKAAALLAYLSLTPGECHREVLATTFWPEGNQQKALANLRRALASLNASLPGWIRADRETIALRRSSKLWVDVEAFHKSHSRFKEHDHPINELCEDCYKVLIQAADMYHGDFLEGLNLDDAPRFDEWQFFQRDGLRQEVAEVWQQLSSEHAKRGRWSQAIASARRWAALDRLHEPACRALMDLYVRSGQRTAALHQYEDLERFLGEQVGQEPEPETRRLYEQIRGRDEAKRLVPAPEHPIPLPLLKTKLYIPAAPGSRVVRSHLLARLDGIQDRALTLISAPAGFGKTTLLAEWIAHTHLPVAWLSLDNGDNDPYRFLAYLIAALESIHEEAGREARQVLQSPQQAPPHIVLASLLNDLSKASGPYVLVLDDYQFMTEHAVHETLGYLVDHLPAGMHLVISTRADPPLQLGRLRAHDRMLELRTRDLRFTAHEATEFLNEVMRLGLSEEDVKALDGRTEGWIVGLKMAALSLGGRMDASEFIRAFSGSHRYVLDYLVEEVLRRQPDHIQTFLMETSILEKLNGPLCDALMTEEWKQSGQSGQSVLEDLERNNLFLIPLDDHKQWYRYHHLFADLLRSRLQNSRGDRDVARLHLCAAAWHEQNGSILEAIQHASLASDDQRVEHLIEQHYMEMVNRGEMSWVRLWMGKLSRELIYRRPWLCLYEALSCSWFGQLEEASLLLNEAEKRIRSQVPPPADRAAMLGYHAYVKSRVTAMQGDTQRAIEFCRTARQAIPADNLGLQNDVGITLGFEYFLYGDFENASTTLHETIRSGSAARAVNNPVAAYALLARLQMYRGRLHEAHDLLQKADRLISESGGRYLGAIGLVEVGTAALLCEWGDVQAALVRAMKGLDLLPLWAKADDLCLAYITLSRIQLALGDPAEAAAAVEKAVQLAQTRGIFSEARGAVETAQVRMWLLQGNRPPVDRWVSALEQRFSPQGPFRYEDELARLTQARVFIARDEPGEAVHLLSCLEESAGSAGRQGRLIEISVLKALALQAAGELTQAVTVLTNSLALAEPGGYLRVFLDEGEPMIRLLKQLRESRSAPPTGTYLNRLLEAAGTPG